MAFSASSSWLVLSATNAKHNPFFSVPSCIKFNAPIASQIQWHSDSYTHRNLRPLPQIKRHWVEASDQSLESPETFSVASYNILGDRNASQHSDLYVNVPSRYIKWDRRKRVISDELLGWDPDIICLQVTNFSPSILFHIFDKLKKGTYTFSLRH